jgi:hypothetical protein
MLFVYIFGGTLWAGDQQGRCLHTGEKKQNKRAQTSIGFEPTTPVFERAATPITILITNKLYGLSPRANYTDRATAACR